MVWSLFTRSIGGRLANEKHEENFRVIDRRLFDESGELRREAVEQEPAEAAKTDRPAATAQNPAPAAEPAPAAAPEPVRPSRAFQMLIDLLYSNAALYLGGYADPTTGRAVVDLEGARNIIDMLEVLRERTRDRLALEEDRMLVEVMGSLKMAFLEVSKAASQAMKQNPTQHPQKLHSKP